MSCLWFWFWVWFVISWARFSDIQPSTQFGFHKQIWEIRSLQNLKIYCAFQKKYHLRQMTILTQSSLWSVDCAFYFPLSFVLSLSLSLSLSFPRVQIPSPIYRRKKVDYPVDMVRRKRDITKRKLMRSEKEKTPRGSSCKHWHIARLLHMNESRQLNKLAAPSFVFKVFFPNLFFIIHFFSKKKLFHFSFSSRNQINFYTHFKKGNSQISLICMNFPCLTTGLV